MVKAFELGLREFSPLWEGVLSEEVLSKLEGLLPMTSGLKFEDDLWVRVVYDFALAVHRKAMAREHLLKSFTPLYLGRVASFILETQLSSHRAVEEKIEELCRTFEKEKPYLIKHWDQEPDHGGQP